MTPEVAEKIAKMIPMLGSGMDGDVVAAARAIGRVLESNSLSFHDLAKTIQSRGTITMTTITANSMDDIFRQPPYRTNPSTGRPTQPQDVAHWQYVIAVVPFLLDENLSERERQFVLTMRTGARRQEAAFRMTVPQRKRWTDILTAFNF